MEDYRLYLSVLHEATVKHDCSIHAYVLMPNHVHLLITPRTSRAIPLVFQALGRRYVQTLNRKYERTGTLWEGRYRASLVDSEAYLLTCYRYIELNPVRAGLNSSPDRYPYSSYHCNAFGTHDPIVTPHPEYLALGEKPEARRAAYRELFSEVLQEPQLSTIRRCVNASQVLGSEKFKDSIELLLGHSVRPGKDGRPRKYTVGRKAIAISSKQ